MSAAAPPKGPPAGRRRVVTLAACALAFLALLAVAALAPLPFSVTYPGATANVLGERDGEPVIDVSGAPVGRTEGELLVTTISATSPDEEVRLADVIGGYFADDRAVLPREAVYPVGDTTREIRRYNAAEMRESQDDAVAAALRYLGLDGGDVTVELNLPGVGGPSAGLLFSLGLIDLLDGGDEGSDLTGGRTIAGTGTIEPDGTVGSVGGVPLKLQAARRDGATVFLVPAAECADATAERPEGLRLVPVETLDGAVGALRALASGGSVPAC